MYIDDAPTGNYQLGDYVINFIEGFCVHTIGPMAGKPMLLDEWQKAFIREMYRLEWIDEEWSKVYQTIVLIIARGASKSNLAAALGLFELSPFSSVASPRVLFAAASRENALQVYGPARDMVQQNDKFRELGMYANKNLIWCDANKGELKRISADGKGQFGHIPSFIVRDELWTWMTDKQVELSEALQTSLVKRPNSQSLAVTTPGYDKETILGQVYTTSMEDSRLENPQPGLSVLRDTENGLLFWGYETPKSLPMDDPAAWKMAQPASWIKESALRSQYSKIATGDITESEFRRQMLCQWTATLQSWFDFGVWEGLQGEREIPEGARVQLGLDAGLRHDSTALVMAWAPDEDSPIVLRALVWSSNPNAPHHIRHEDEVDLRAVRDYILNELKPKYKITEIRYDPRFFATIARDLSDAGFTMVEVAQGSPVSKDGYELFHKLVTTGGVEHDGDKVFAQHVNGTSAKMTERGWFVEKLRSKWNDAAVAACMVVVAAKNDIAKRNVVYVYGGRKKDVQETKAV